MDRLEYLQNLRSQVGADYALFWALSAAIDCVIGASPMLSYEKTREYVTAENLKKGTSNVE